MRKTRNLSIAKSGIGHSNHFVNLMREMYLARMVLDANMASNPDLPRLHVIHMGRSGISRREIVILDFSHFTP